MPRLSRLLRLSFATLLLSAWQVALLHPLQHVDAQGAFVHVPGGGASKSPDGKRGSNALPCDMLAAVAACIASAPQPAVAAATAVDSMHVRETARLPGAPSLAYRSQAPPSLL